MHMLLIMLSVKNLIVLGRIIIKLSELVSNPFVFVYTIKYVQFRINCGSFYTDTNLRMMTVDRGSSTLTFNQIINFGNFTDPFLKTVKLCSSLNKSSMDPNSHLTTHKIYFAT